MLAVAMAVRPVHDARPESWSSIYAVISWPDVEVFVCLDKSAAMHRDSRMNTQDRLTRTEGYATRQASGFRM